MPYRIDLPGASDRVLDRLIALGAIDVEASAAGVAALMPDDVVPEQVASAAGVERVSVSAAVGRDAESVWVLTPRPVQVGRIRIVPAHLAPESGTIRLIDTAAFGTGLHPTTALCLECLEDAIQNSPPDDMLDVGTGSGVLALAALKLGVTRVLGIDTDDEALRAAADNARLNAVADRLQLARGGPDTIEGMWPLVVANIAAAPLIEMAPALVRRVGHRGRLVLSGIPLAVEPDVDRAYRRRGMHRIASRARGSWSALVLVASW